METTYHLMTLNLKLVEVSEVFADNTILAELRAENPNDQFICLPNPDVSNPDYKWAIFEVIE